MKPFLIAKIALGLVSSCLVGLPSRTNAAEPAQDENLAYATGVQTYINGFPMMDLYRTLWETSFDPKRGHDRTLNEFFVFDRLITSKDDWVITPNNDTRCMIVNPQGKTEVNSRQDIVKNEDGSVRLVFSPTKPDGVPDANWIQTNPKKGFFAYFRWYSPTKAFFDRSWKMGNIKEIQ